MNIVLNALLSYKGIFLLTMLTIFLAGIVYCRVVTGIGVSDVLNSVQAFHSPAAEPPSGGLASKLRNFIRGASPSGSDGPAYEEIAMTGGDGRGTVSEVLAQETEKQLRGGEQAQDDFFAGAGQSDYLRGLEFEDRTPASPQEDSDGLFDGFSIGDTYEP